MLIGVLFLVLVSAAVAANHGPIRAYYEARTRVQEAQARVAALEEEKARLQTELGRLTEASYLETLAREELAYARPGEELYIVTGTDEGAGAASGAQAGGSGLAGEGSSPAAEGAGAALGAASGTQSGASSSGATPEPGFFERLVRAFLGLF